MDSKIALDKVKEAEQKAQQIIEEAQAKARDILRDAELAKESMVKAAQEKARLAAQKLRIEIEEEAKKEAALIQNKNEEDVRALKEKARANFDKALKFIKAKIE